MPMPITPISTSVLRHPVVDQHAVGPEHNHEAELHGVARDVEDIRTDERFAARNHEEAALVDLGNLIDELIAFFGREFVVPAGGLRRRIEIAMVALEIAAFCEVQRNEIGLEVVDGPAIVRRSAMDDGVKNCDICCWMFPNAPTRDGALKIGRDLPIV